MSNERDAIVGLANGTLRNLRRKRALTPIEDEKTAEGLRGAIVAIETLRDAIERGQHLGKNLDPVQATEAGMAETGTGSVHEGAVGKADAPEPCQEQDG